MDARQIEAGDGSSDESSELEGDDVQESETENWEQSDAPMTEAGGHSSTESGELDNSKVAGEQNLTCASIRYKSK